MRSGSWLTNFQPQLNCAIDPYILDCRPEANACDELFMTAVFRVSLLMGCKLILTRSVDAISWDHSIYDITPSLLRSFWQRLSQIGSSLETRPRTTPFPMGLEAKLVPQDAERHGLQLRVLFKSQRFKGNPRDSLRPKEFLPKSCQSQASPAVQLAISRERKMPLCGRLASVPGIWELQVFE